VLLSEAINKLCVSLGISPFVHWIPSAFNLADHVTRGTLFIVNGHAIKLNLHKLPADAWLCKARWRCNFKGLFLHCRSLVWQTPPPVEESEAIATANFLTTCDRFSVPLGPGYTYEGLEFGVPLGINKWLDNIVLPDAHLWPRGHDGLQVLGSLRSLGSIMTLNIINSSR
jgi:hypothetical protein